MLQGNERVLVVDDDELISESLAVGLKASGYQCEIAGSAEDADRILRRERFDLTILDIGLPGKSGLTFLLELTHQYPDMAIVMLTGLDDTSTAVLAMREGAYDYVAKPTPLGVLIIRVAKALSRRALLLEKKEYYEKLESVVDDLTRRFEQSRRELAPFKKFVQTDRAGEQTTLAERDAEQVARLESALMGFGSGIDRLRKIAERNVTAAP